MLEQKTIADYDTYHNGYNCTQGGEGNPRVFDYYTACALWHIMTIFAQKEKEVM